MQDYELIRFRSPAELLENASRWDALWQRSGVSFPAARAAPLAVWLNHHARDAEFYAAAVQQDGRLLAALPLVTRRVARGVQVLALPSDYGTPMCDLLLDPSCDASAVMRLLLEGVRDLESPLLWLDGVAYQRPWWKAFLDAAGSHGWLADIRDQHRVGQIELTGSWENYFADRSKRHRSNRRNEARRIERAGGGELKIVTKTDNADVEQLLRQGFALEQRSWKAATGTCVLQQPCHFQFYVEMAQVLMRLGHLEMVTMELAGTPMAFALTWHGKGVQYGMKICCDQNFKAFAPGHQLLMRYLQRSFAQDQWQLFDMVGPAAPWHLRWATQTYPVGRVVVALPSRYSRTMFHLYTRWQPRLRGLRSRLQPSLNTIA